MPSVLMHERPHRHFWRRSDSNDHFGKWREEFHTLAQRCRDEACLGRAIAELVAPSSDDYVVLQPKHSAFFATPLELLLQSLAVRHLILTGISADQCILYTATWRRMPTCVSFALCVPSDCTTSLNATVREQALEHICPSTFGRSPDPWSN